MANLLKMANVHSILTPLQQGWSQRRIARALGVYRGTVARRLRAAERAVSASEGTDVSNAANAPIGSGVLDAGSCTREAVPGMADYAPWPPGAIVSKAANTPPGPDGRMSDCEPYRAIIEDKLEQGLSAVRIHQDPTAEPSAAVSYPVCDDLCNGLDSAGRYLPADRVAAGRGALVDFGTGAPRACFKICPCTPASSGCSLFDPERNPGTSEPICTQSR